VKDLYRNTAFITYLFDTSTVWKTHSSRATQWADAEYSVTALPTANAGQNATSHCNPQLTVFFK